MKTKKIISRSLVVLAEKVIGRQIEVLKHKPVFYRKHPKAVGSGKSIRVYCNLLKDYTTIQPRNVFEIGANLAQDAEGFRAYFNIDPSNVYCFEPHPILFDEISKFYSFNTYKLGISNYEGNTNFNIVPITSPNNGISSIKTSKNTSIEYDSIEIEVKTLDKFIDENQIEYIDFLKIDVEGLTFEVLKGLNTHHRIVGSIQLEAEHKIMWENQHLFNDIYQLLNSWNFELIHFTRTGASGLQSDSLWVKKEFIK